MEKPIVAARPTAAGSVAKRKPRESAEVADVSTFTMFAPPFGNLPLKSETSSCPGRQSPTPNWGYREDAGMSAPGPISPVRGVARLRQLSGVHLSYVRRHFTGRS